MIVKYRHLLLMAMVFVIPFWIKGVVMATCQVAYVIWRKRPSEYKGKLIGILIVGVGLFVGMNGISDGAIGTYFLDYGKTLHWLCIGYVPYLSTQRGFDQSHKVPGFYLQYIYKSPQSVSTVGFYYRYCWLVVYAYESHMDGHSWCKSYGTRR